MNSNLVKYIEGETEILVPSGSLVLDHPPKEPAFFNPRGIENRDLSIIAYESYCDLLEKPVVFTDLLCGVGVRGIRIAKETSVFKIFLNDSNPNAIEIAKINAEINQIKDKCTFFNDDANHFLISSRNNGNLFNVIDVDPFGTPAPFLEDIVKTIMGGGLISVTATDAPVLCGIHPLVALRKYYGRSLHVEYCHEVGIRLLFSALAFAASRYDRGIKPLFCHLTRHYFRIYAQVSTGAEEAKASIGKIGYINHCTNCNERNTSDIPLDKCKVCGGKLSYAGPLWVGKIFDLEFLKKMIQVANEKGFQRYLKMLNMSVEEIDSPPTYFLISMICDRLQIRTPSIVKIIEKLGEYGFTSSRTMLNNRAIKTNAPSKVVNEVLISLSHVRQADQV